LQTRPVSEQSGLRGQCCGDCNGDGRVTVDELVGAVDRGVSSGACGTVRFISVASMARAGFRTCGHHGAEFPARERVGRAKDPAAVRIKAGIREWALSGIVFSFSDDAPTQRIGLEVLAARLGAALL